MRREISAVAERLRADPMRKLRDATTSDAQISSEAGNNYVTLAHGTRARRFFMQIHAHGLATATGMLLAPSPDDMRFPFRRFPTKSRCLMP